MKPLPAPLPSQLPTRSESDDGSKPSIHAILSAPNPSHPKSSRLPDASASQRAYPWLLCISTLLAGVFCLMYITKPVIVTSQAPSSGLSPTPVLPNPATPLVFSTTAPPPSLMPSQDTLPGEKSITRPVMTGGSEAQSATRPAEAFEQTNLHIQHILTAEAPGGHLSKIDLDVPVLYQSRNLRWTVAEVAQARELMTRLADYQEKSRNLRSEGAELLESWNHLIEHSIPAGALRADSPTLPANQQDAADTPRPAGLDTTELIRIQPAKK